MSFLQATQAVKIQFEIDKKSSSLNLIFQKSSSDQQGVWLIQWNWQKTTLWFDYDIQTENRREYLWLFSMEEKVLHVLFDIQKRVIGITITYLPIHTYFSTGLALREIYFDPSILITKKKWTKIAYFRNSYSALK